MENENENEKSGEALQAVGEHAVVDRARSIVAATTEVSATTINCYKVKGKLLTAQRKVSLAAGEPGWDHVLMPYAPNPNSYQVMSNALKWVLKSALKTMLLRYDATEGDEAAKEKRAEAAAFMRGLLHDLDAVCEISRKGLLAQSGETARPVRSKRGNMKHDEWGSKMLSMALKSRKWGPVVWALLELGCRPSELLKGVQFLRVGSKVRLRVLGAKVRDKVAGQKEREVEIPVSSVPQPIMSLILADGGETVVRIKSDAVLRNRLARWGRMLWPTGPRVSAIDFRHSVAEDLREQGWDAMEIAEVLGHAVDGTSKRYGRRRRPGQRKNTSKERALVRGSATVSEPVRSSAKKTGWDSSNGRPGQS